MIIPCGIFSLVTEPFIVYYGLRDEPNIWILLWTIIFLGYWGLGLHLLLIINNKAWAL